MHPDRRLFAPAGSPAVGAAAALAWLWRLGVPLTEPDADAVGLGVAADQETLVPLLESGRLAGVVLFAGEEGPADGVLPPRRLARGIAHFQGGGALRAELPVFDGGTPAVRSSLGAHAVREDGVLALAAGPDTACADLRGFWAISALAAFLVERLRRPLVMLPPVGCVRLDDVPGTAQHQAQGIAHSDRRARRRIERLRRTYSATDARLNVAVCSRALVDSEEAPLDEVWPGSVAALAEGVDDGVFEPVCHGYLHLDLDLLEEDGTVEYREFRDLDEAEAGRRLDASLAWQEERLGRRPETFVAPAWSYSEGAFAAAAARRLPAWVPAAAAPMLEGDRVHESVDNGFRGMHRLGYAPLLTLAAHGVPATPVLHGGLLDRRARQLRETRDVLTAARLGVARDLLRIPRLRGLRWIGTGELVRMLREHDGIEVRGSEVSLDGAGHAVLFEGDRVRAA